MLKKILEKPKEERHKAALISSFSITMVILLGWVIGKGFLDSNPNQKVAEEQNRNNQTATAANSLKENVSNIKQEYDNMKSSVSGSIYYKP